MQAVWKHRQALREHTPLGIAGLPYLVLLQVVLPLLGPVLDVFSLYGLAFLNPLPVMGFWLAFNVIQALLAAYAFRLDSEPMRPLWALPLQQFVYRQLMYLIILESLGTALSGRRLRWQKLSRTGVVIAPSHPAG